ncbi:hypothetical protein [Actinoplanes sp. CA-252034]|uniref:hypothetical protein n=1 Tax=Actinoplanes sp. CA-252034 TaxID=3239906 RepID=UPI003D987BFD
MTSTDSTPEYDRFGPWIDEVRTVDQLPRLYREAGIDPAAYRKVLKVPRDIEGRNTHPTMHLYDYLLAVNEETFTVLARRDEAFYTVHVPLDRIAAIVDSVRLLNGRLTVHTVDGPVVTVVYNASASAPVRDLLLLLRRYYLPETSTADAEPHRGTDPTMDPVDTGLLTDYHRLIAEEPSMRLVNIADRQVVTQLNRTDRLWSNPWPTTLHASITVADQREIQIIHRRDWFTGNGDKLSLARTVLPRARITDIRVEPHRRYEGVHVLTIQAGATRLEFPLATGPLVEAKLAGDAVSI